MYQYINVRISWWNGKTHNSLESSKSIILRIGNPFSHPNLPTDGVSLFSHLLRKLNRCCFLEYITENRGSIGKDQ